MSDPHANGFARNETVAFERSDVDTRVILLFVAGLGVSLVGVMGVIWLLFSYLLNTETRDKRSTYHLAEAFRESRPNVEDRLPSGPRLEGMAIDAPGGHTIGRMWPSTVARQSAEDLAIIENGGWIVLGKLACLPIHEAIKRLAKTGASPKPAYDQMPNGTSSGRAPNGGSIP